jgi:hypothetical protein
METPNRAVLKAIFFQDAQAAIDGTLESWLPQLVESNDALEGALVLLRELYMAPEKEAEDVVLKRVEDALSKAAAAKSAF